MDNKNLDYHQLSQQGEELMRKAIDCIRKGDFEGSNKYREEANKILDCAIQTMNSDCAKMTMLYGENRNFGIIYNVFERNLSEMQKTKQGRKVLGEAMKMIMSDRNLKDQYNVYLSFDRNVAAPHPNLYVEQALSMMPKANRKEIVESNEKLIQALKKCNEFNEHLDIDDTTMKCYEAVETLIMTPQTPQNMDKIVEAKATLLEHLSNLPPEAIKESIKFQNNIIEEINAREESDIPTESEYRIYKEIAEASDKNELFNKYKTEILEEIESIISSKPENNQEWKETYDLVKEQKFDKSSPFLSIGKLVEIRDMTINGI